MATTSRRRKTTSVYDHVQPSSTKCMAFRHIRYVVYLKQYLVNVILLADTIDTTTIKKTYIFLPRVSRRNL